MTTEPSMPVITHARSIALLGLSCASGLASAQTCAQPSTGPDLVIGELPGVQTFGAVGGTSAYALAVTLCNYGDAPAQWAASTPAHPAVATNLYRLHDGRFQQLGQSWARHEFFALQQATCCPCSPAGAGTALGVGCSTPTSASIGGAQPQLGPRSEINASTGEFVMPFGAAGQSDDAVYKRLQALTTDLDPAAFPTAQYFAEAQVVAEDDAASGNAWNNVSWRPLARSGAVVGGAHHLILAGATVPAEPALAAWQAAVPSVDLVAVDVPGDGRFWVASDAIAIPGGGYRYEYAVMNQGSHRSLRRFSVPIDLAAQISGASMSFPLAHSGEPYDNVPWSVSVLPDRVVFETNPFATHPNANALRWGTTYSFWFVADSAPGPRTAELGLFRPGAEPDPMARVTAPSGVVPSTSSYCVAVPNSTGVTGVFEARDFALAARMMSLVGSSLPPQAMAYSLASLTPGFVAFPGGSAGNLCLGGSIGRRVGGAVLSTGSSGTFFEQVDLDRVPQPLGPVAVQAGETWYFQLWHRDLSGGAATSNFTRGLSVQFP